jgi:hypothetical protein
LTGITPKNQLLAWGRQKEATMGKFDHILNWKLKKGSHPFPGKDGGTCVNEAALVAAGFPYRRIRCVEDMPVCFSRPICRLAMYLNDHASDKDRQRLLPFVTRLACADRYEVERQRDAFIDARTRPFLTFSEGLEILEGALQIGRRAEDAPYHDVTNRMEAAQRTAKGSDEPIFEKLKTWLS